MLLIVIGVIALTGSDKNSRDCKISVGGFLPDPELFTDFFRSINFFWPCTLQSALGCAPGDRNGCEESSLLTFNKADYIDYVNTSAQPSRTHHRELREARSLPFRSGELNLTRHQWHPVTT